MLGRLILLGCGLGPFPFQFLFMLDQVLGGALPYFCSFSCSVTLNENNLPFLESDLYIDLTAGVAQVAPLYSLDSIPTLSELPRLDILGCHWIA